MAKVVSNYPINRRLNLTFDPEEQLKKEEEERRQVMEHFDYVGYGRDEPMYSSFLSDSDDRINSLKSMLD